ncbi:putative V-type proton ATPase subunit H [Porphyridium purpureum]|uniref:Putative V-type proton ATPase subunit H n=1 Tax=Porphyridium purpureum TaxID=35688 RepID=A0A5J4YU75_PORPP|nr:putative V-type proton ATPase subunit H [Porphyridium purpureum]|eukprot:POR3255..scf227_4
MGTAADGVGHGAPWTVVSQGTSVGYEQAKLVDQWEAVLSAGAAYDVEPFLAAGAHETARALLALLTEVGTAADLLRASELLAALLARKGGKAAVMQLLVGDMQLLAKLAKQLAEMHTQPAGGMYAFQLQDSLSVVVGRMLAGLLATPAVTESETLSKQLTAYIVAMFAWITEQLRMREIVESHYVKSLESLGEILRVEKARLLLCDASAEHVKAVAQLVDKEQHHQVQALYQSVFVLWLLSFAAEPNTVAAVSKAMDEAFVPRRLCLLLREVTAEKVVRLCVATLNNLTQGKFSARLRREMVGAGIIKTVEQLCVRRWADTDILNDMHSLAENLQEEKKQMSSFEMYHSEVLSGVLQWTHVHTDDMFWRENVEKMERSNMEVLRCLVRLLAQSSDPVVLSVACNDLSMFIKYHPRGRYIAQSLGVKTRLMQLMGAESPEVRRHALNCIQVLMITHWDHLNTAL